MSLPHLFSRASTATSTPPQILDIWKYVMTTDISKFGLPSAVKPFHPKLL